MTTYTPEGWIVLKVDEGKKGIWYRIFGTWRGSYLEGDRWRLSSGSKESPYEDESGVLVWEQASGSVYELEKTDVGGTTFYTQGVVKEIMERLENSDVKVELVNALDDLLNLLPIEQWNSQKQD